MKSFWTGFTKTANILSKLDAQGGVAPRAPEEIAAAQAVDLRTLPKTVEGASCGNCRFLKVLDPKKGMGMCQNPSVMQEVTERMICSAWDSPGTLRNWEMADEADVPPPAAGGQVDPATGQPLPGQQQGPGGEMAPEAVDQNPAGAEAAMAGAQTGQPMETAPQTPAKKEKTESKPKPDKKDSGKGAGDINIHVGGAGAEKKAAEKREYDGPHHSLTGAAVGGMAGHQAAKWLGVRSGLGQAAITAVAAAKGARSMGLSDYEFKKKREAADKKFLKGGK